MKADILHVVPYYHPLSGGPPVVVQRLVEEMRRAGVRSRVISTDACAPPGDTAWIASIGSTEEIQIISGARLGEYAWQNELGSLLDRAVTDARMVAVHGCWNWPTLSAMRACRKHSIPYVVMPHGMLDPHSMARGRWKKRLYGPLVEWPVIRDAQAMVYTNEAEQTLARQSVRRLPAGVIAPLGTDWPPDARATLASEFLTKYPQLKGKQCAVFLGRLHPKKGLDLLIPAWKLISQQIADARLIIAGEGSDDFVTDLKNSVKNHSISESVIFTGMLNGRDKWGALAAADLFLLPSYQENFGLAVVEALASGTPAVISRRVNIWQPLVLDQAAVACELDSASVATLTCRLLNDPETRSAMAEAAIDCVRSRFHWKKTSQAFERLLERFG